MPSVDKSAEKIIHFRAMYCTDVTNISQVYASSEDDALTTVAPSKRIPNSRWAIFN